MKKSAGKILFPQINTDLKTLINAKKNPRNQRKTISVYQREKYLFFLPADKGR